MDKTTGKYQQPAVDSLIPSEVLEKLESLSAHLKAAIAVWDELQGYFTPTPWANK